MGASSRRNTLYLNAFITGEIGLKLLNNISHGEVEDFFLFLKTMWLFFFFLNKTSLIK